MNLVSRDSTEEQLRNELVKMQRRIVELEASGIHLRRALQKLRREKDFLLEIIRNSSETVMALTPQGQISFISPGMQRLFGWNSFEPPTLEQATTLLFPEDSLRVVLQMWKNDIRAGSGPERFLTASSREGKRIRCRFKVLSAVNGTLLFVARKTESGHQNETGEINLFSTNSASTG